MGYIGSKEYLNVVEKLSESWKKDKAFWDDPADLLGTKQIWPGGAEDIPKVYKGVLSDAKRLLVESDVSDFLQPYLPEDTGNLPSPNLIDMAQIESTMKMMHPESFIHQSTRNNITPGNAPSLQVDGPLSDPMGTVGDTGGWYYYTFDWRSFKNLVGEQSYQVGDDNLRKYYKSFAVASIPYFCKSLGKKFEKIGGKTITSPTAWVKNYVEFGGYTLEVRASVDSELDKKGINPGLTFLFGISKLAVDQLADDTNITLSLQDLVPDRAIIMRVGDIDDDLNYIGSTINVYRKVREDLEERIEINPTKCTFATESDRVHDFKSALKTLLQESTNIGTDLPKNKSVGGNSALGPIKPSISQLEEWARYPTLWGKPGNIIEIGITKTSTTFKYKSGKPPGAFDTTGGGIPKGVQAWSVAYVREYAPETAFNAGPTAPGLLGIQRLGPIKFSRIIGAGYNASFTSVFEDFKKSSGVRQPRTIHFISRMHEGNSTRKPGGMSPKVDFAINPDTNAPKLNIKDFVEKYVYGGTEESSKSSIAWFADDPVKYQKGLDGYLKKNGGPLASHAQRSLTKSKSNSADWAEKYNQYRLDKWVIGHKDEFWKKIHTGEKLERLRIDESAPYGFDLISKEVLNQADVKRLTTEALRCWLNPDEWLEIACRYAMKELKVDEWYEEMAKDGTLDKLKGYAETAQTVSAAASAIDAQKRIKQQEMHILIAERDKHSKETLDLLNKKSAIQEKINKTTNIAQLKTLRDDKTLIDQQIKSAMGRRRQVEMDSVYAKHNSSAGTYMPSSYLGASNADVAQAGNNISKAIMKVSDPNFKKELCKNIISYSAKATQLIVELSKSAWALTKPDEDGKKTKLISKDNEGDEASKRPRAQTTNFGMYADELIRSVAAEAAAATMLFFVKRILNEIVLACQNLKNSLWDDINKPKDQTPGNANFNDLLDFTPDGAAKELAKKIGGTVDLTNSDITANLMGLMEDLELLLSQAELCALTKGQASLSVLKIVKNLLRIKYEDLYFQLSANDQGLSLTKIKEFFKNFEDLVKGEYCDEIQKVRSTQLYHECDLPPYIHSLCGDLLEGHATAEQIENVCSRAKLERLDTLIDLIDAAYSPKPIPEPSCDDPDYNIPHDPYPINAITDSLIDQNFDAVSTSFKSELYSFQNKIFTGYATGFAPIDPNQQEAIKTQKDELPDPEKKAIFSKIRESLHSPFQWIPSYSAEKLLSNFYMRTPLISSKIGDSMQSTKDTIEYSLSESDPNEQIIQANYWIGKDKAGPFNYVLNSGEFVLENVTTQIKKYLHLYSNDAPKVIDGDIKVGGPGYVSYNAAANAIKDEDGYYHSPLDDEFYEAVLGGWKELSGVGGLSASSDELKKYFYTATRDMGNHLSKSVLKSLIFQPEGYDMLRKFFNGFFPKEVFAADIQCDIKDVSFLDIEELKQKVRDRNKDLSCGGPQPDMDNETPNLSRAMGEGVVYLLARIYAVETFLRLLPISTTFKIKDVFESETVINLIVYNIVHELAMLDYRKTWKTVSGENVEKNENNKPGTKNLIDPNGGPLILRVDSDGNSVYVEEPATMVVAPKAGKDFEPKFQAHVIYYANNILMSKVEKANKERTPLLDPLTNEPYVYDDSPYSLSGIKYLLKEQIASVSNFIEREFESSLDIEVSDWKSYVMSSFLHQYALDDETSLFDLMPEVATINKNADQDEFYFLTKPRFYRHVMNRYKMIYTIPNKATGATGATQEMLDEFDADLGTSADEEAALEALLAGVIAAKGKPDQKHVGSDIVINNFSNLSNIGPNGGFILQPYIRVRQHKKISELTINISQNETLKEAYALKMYDKKIKDMYASTAQKKYYIDSHCVNKKGNELKKCKASAESGWHKYVIDLAMKKYNQTLNADFVKLSSIDDNIETDLPDELGAVWNDDGAYINLNQWKKVMTDSNFGLAKYKSAAQSSLPHTDFFDQWMYGLRLVFVLPLDYDYSKAIGDTAEEKETATAKRKLKPDDNTPYEINFEDILKSFKNEVPETKGNPWAGGANYGLLEKKAWILHEEIPDVLFDITNTGKMGKYSEETVSPPIFEIPLINVEIPVGDLDLTEQGELYDFYYKKAKNENNSDAEAKIIASAAQQEAKSPVPLGYFSYQDSVEDEFPLYRLLDLMTKTDEFEQVFGKIFQIDNFKTLISLYTLMQTYDLNEYTERNASGEILYGSLYRTKDLLRSVFYSNTQAADPTKGGSSTASTSHQNEIESAEQGSKWDRYKTLMLGDPPDPAKIMAMTPIGILKGYVSLTDPAWSSFPWTPAGLTMFLLEKSMGPALSGGWFGDDVGKKDEKAEVETPVALDCPTEQAGDLSKDVYTEEEKMFDFMMKISGVIETDRKFILRKIYDSPSYPGWQYVYDKTNSFAVPVDPNTDLWPKRSKTRRFSDTGMFQVLRDIGKIKPGADLGVIYSTLREYFDTLIETEAAWLEYTKQYTIYVQKIAGSGKYFKNGAWIASSDFLSVLLFTCEDAYFPGKNYIYNQEAICKAKTAFNLAKQQLESLVTLYHEIFAELELDFNLIYGRQLPSAYDFRWNKEISLLSPVKHFGESISVFDDVPDDAQMIQKNIDAYTKTSKAIPHTALPEETVKSYVADALRLLVLNNEKLFGADYQSHKASWAEFGLAPLNFSSWHAWANTAEYPKDFNLGRAHSAGGLAQVIEGNDMRKGVWTENLFGSTSATWGLPKNNMGPGALITAKNTPWGKNLKQANRQNALLRGSTSYNLYDPGDYLDIADYWLYTAVPTKTSNAQLNPKGHIMIPVDPDAGGVQKNAWVTSNFAPSQAPLRVFDWLMWYYPLLATGVFEMLYKYHNVYLDTASLSKFSETFVSPDSKKGTVKWTHNLSIGSVAQAVNKIALQQKFEDMDLKL